MTTSTALRTTMLLACLLMSSFLVSTVPRNSDATACTGNCCEPDIPALPPMAKVNTPASPFAPSTVRPASDCGGTGRGKVLPCGTVSAFYAGGSDNDTVDDYSVYGASTTATIRSQTVCGTAKSTGSAVVNFIVVFFPTTCVDSDGYLVNATISLGYFQGISPNNTWASTPHYYWDRFLPSGSGGQSACLYSFHDISQDHLVYPQVGTQVTFQLQGSFNTGQHYWTLTIAPVSAGTGITLPHIHGSADYGSLSTVETESHNNNNTASAQFSSIQNLKQLLVCVSQCPTGNPLCYNGQVFQWAPWASSYPWRWPADSSNPYYATQSSTTSFCMSTGSSGGC